MSTPENPWAFAWMNYTPEGNLHDGGEGMTLRDYFAGQALAGITTKPILKEKVVEIVSHCYGIAELMLDERERRQRADYAEYLKAKEIKDREKAETSQ